MPLINIIWMGTIITSIGFGVAVFRRYREAQQASKSALQTPISGKKTAIKL
jgi:cytochrome c biogenesis factor